MANYIIFLEGIDREFFMEADTTEEALAKAKKKYRLSKIADVIEDGKPIVKQKCIRCGYEFVPSPERNSEEPYLIVGMKLPKTCPNPKCKSPYWNKPRQK